MAAPQNQAKKEELFKQFLSKARVCVVDPSSASRRRLMETMIDLGAPTSSVTSFGKYEEAEAAIREGKPQVIISEYKVGGRSGLDLFQMVRDGGQNTNDSLFVLITGDSSQSTVARAAEEDVDTFVLKPYTMQTLTETLVTSAVEKLFPTPYRKKIDDGKALLFSGKIDEAMATFQEAMKLDPKPALACYYYGQAETMRNALEDAKGTFAKGLTFNKIHYKCLIGMFDLFIKQEAFGEAYRIVKKIAHFFPANPKRLTQIIHLAIRTKNFEDIDSYYQSFVGIEERNDELTKYVCTGMVITAKFYFQEQTPDKAIDLLKKASVSASGKSTLLRLIIELLMDFNYTADAKEILKRFVPEEQKGPDYLASKFLVEDRELDITKSAEIGRELLRNGIHLPKVYRALIKRLFELKKDDEVKKLCEESVKRWPEEKTFLERYTIDPAA